MTKFNLPIADYEIETNKHGTVRFCFFLSFTHEFHNNTSMYEELRSLKKAQWLLMEFFFQTNILLLIRFHQKQSK